MKNYKLLFGLLLFFTLFFRIQYSYSQNDAGMLRFPDINKNLVCFVHAGDIWSVSAKGGEAKRLTSHYGLELFPKISPNGKWIAFSAEYTGSRQVYVMPAEGGIPKQLTYYNEVGVMPPRGGYDHIVLDWTPDSEKILFRGNRTPFGKRVGKYFLIDINGGLEEELQIPEGSFATFSPDGKKICYTPISREFRTWKRYKGGRAADVWIYDLENDLSEKITTFKGSDQIPYWYKDKIYFASDRDLRLNIHSYNTKSKKTEQITKHIDFDVLYPSGNGSLMVYENGGFLYKLDLETGNSEKINISIHFDNPNLIAKYKKIKKDIRNIAISPSGKRVLLGARGDIFSVPAKNGKIYNLTNSMDSREINPSWSPDGKYILYYSDKTGEYEIYLLENKVGAKSMQLTKNSKSWKFPGVWSSDSKKYVYLNQDQEIELLDIESKKTIVIDKARQNEVFDYSFSSDSKWICYSNSSDNGNNTIRLYSIDNKKNYEITENTFNSFAPVFSPDGKYVYFLSNRDFNLSFSSFEFNYVYNKATKIYAVSLNKSTSRLFEFKNDLEISEKSKGESKESDKESITIDMDNIQNRIVAFPLQAGNYHGIIATEGAILYFKNASIYKYSIADKKDQLIIRGVMDLDITPDLKSILYRSGDKIGIIPVKPEQKVGTGELKLDNLMMKIDPKKEWNQIFNDTKRIVRDWFYVENLHGVDWEGVCTKYNKMLDKASHRSDLDYIIGEMIGELNVGHAYAGNGDYKHVKRISGGLLGAKLVADKRAGRYKIEKIYKGENWTNNRRSPLTDQGVNINEGDYILAIDGEEIPINENPYKYLENKANQYVTVTINSKPNFSGAENYTIKTIDSELDLLYFNWVESRRKIVDELSGGKIGYIHVPNTAIEGNEELFKGMYAYHNKQALIIDDRYNGGGFIPDVMADLLDRKTLSYWGRQDLNYFKTPAIAHDGPKAMLINHYSSSGGDAFPYYFRKKNLGTIIGTRTWGGLVGLAGNADFIDGSSIEVPSFGVYNEKGEWIIEGIGVSPDIEVIDEPHLIVKGKDPSLEKAVEILLKKLEKNPKNEIKRPKDPNRKEWIEEK